MEDLTGHIKGLVVDESGCGADDLVYCGAVQVTVEPGILWADLVERAVASEWVGIEALGSVPGTVGEAVARNAAAHGQAVGDVVVSVRTWDRHLDTQKTFAAVDCGFGEATSRFLEELPEGSRRFSILDVAFLFKQGQLTAPLQDADLAGLLGLSPGSRATLSRVYAATR